MPMNVENRFQAIAAIETAGCKQGSPRSQIKVSALGQKQTQCSAQVMSALTSTSDIKCLDRHVRLAPEADAKMKEVGLVDSAETETWSYHIPATIEKMGVADLARPPSEKIYKVAKN